MEDREADGTRLQDSDVRTGLERIWKFDDAYMQSTENGFDEAGLQRAVFFGMASFLLLRSATRSLRLLSVLDISMRPDRTH